MHTGFWWRNLRERDHLEDTDIYGRIIFKSIFRKWDGGMDWIDLFQSTDRGQAYVDAVMNLQVP